MAGRWAKPEVSQTGTERKRPGGGGGKETPGRKGKERRQAKANGISEPVGRRETDDPGPFGLGRISNPGPLVLNSIVWL